MWKHLVIDNFFDSDDNQKLINLIKNVNLNQIKNDGNLVFGTHLINDNINKNDLIKFQIKPDDIKNVFKEKINKDLISQLHKKYLKKIVGYLNELNPQKASLFDSSEFRIAVQGKNYTYPYHVDTPKKILSTVIYMEPENNIGTLLSSSGKNDNTKEIEWKRNRALIFSRKNNVTWHSLKSDGKNVRITIIFNLMSDSVKKVRLAEDGFIKYFFKRIFIKQYETEKE